LSVTGAASVENDALSSNAQQSDFFI